MVFFFCDGSSQSIDSTDKILDSKEEKASLLCLPGVEHDVGEVRGLDLFATEPAAV